MSKKSKKSGLKFYFQLNGSATIQSVYSSSIEEAEKSLDEKYGEGNYTLGSLHKVYTKEEKQRDIEISEEVVRNLFGEMACRIMHDINSL